MTQNNKVPTSRLEAFAQGVNTDDRYSFAGKGELKSMAGELLAYRNSSNPLQQVLDKFEEKK